MIIFSRTHHIYIHLFILSRFILSFEDITWDMKRNRLSKAFRSCPETDKRKGYHMGSSFFYIYCMQYWSIFNFHSDFFHIFSIQIQNFCLLLFSHQQQIKMTMKKQKNRNSKSVYKFRIFFKRVLPIYPLGLENPNLFLKISRY